MYRLNLDEIRSLRLICCTTNNLSYKISVCTKCVFGFLKDNIKGHCRHSLRFFTCDCVPCSSIYRGLIEHEMTPIRIG